VLYAVIENQDLLALTDIRKPLQTNMQNNVAGTMMLASQERLALAR
jgi:hypothetical protein